jgi:hypothetical protein
VTALTAADREARDVAAVLTRAADRLDELAARSHAAPWWVVEDHGRDFTGEGYSSILVTSGPQAVTSRGPRSVAVMIDSGVGDGDDILSSAAWIAAMSPAVAAPLVAWLRSEADAARLVQEATGVPQGGAREAVEFARLALGEPATPSVEVATSEEATA